MDGECAERSAMSDEARARYLAKLDQAFASAQRRVGSAPDRTFELAGESMRLRYAGEALTAIFGPALAHLPAAGGDARWEILCWDGAATGLRPPAPSSSWPSAWPAGGVFFPFGPQSARVSIDPDTGVTTVFCAASRRALVWVPDARELPGQHYGSPLLNIFTWWSNGAGLSLLHAGCVGTERGAILLVGKGGAGKSTTCLLCAEAGMDYLGDDYCLLRISSDPVALSLYSSGKLHREHLANFPRFAPIAVRPHVDPLAKPIVFVGQHSRFTVRIHSPLRAILVPAISGEPTTHVEPTTSAAALRALAPSTLLQLPNDGRELLPALARLVRALPCFRLNLGTRLSGIAPAVRTLVDGLS
jgi:hypothetical protein